MRQAGFQQRQKKSGDVYGCLHIQVEQDFINVNVAFEDAEFTGRPYICTHDPVDVGDDHTILIGKGGQVNDITGFQARLYVGGVVVYMKLDAPYREVLRAYLTLRRSKGKAIMICDEPECFGRQGFVVFLWPTVKDGNKL